MNRDLFTDLSWLPEPPDDFVTQCRTIASENAVSIGKKLRELAGYSLTENNLNRLAKLVKTLRDDNVDMSPLTPFKLGIIGNSTTHFSVPALIATALRYGILLECVEGEYDQMLQDAQSPDSLINQFKPDAVLVALNYRGLIANVSPSDIDAADSSVNAALSYINGVREGIKKNSGAICIFQSIPRPVEPSFGSFDTVLPGSIYSLIRRFNEELAYSARGTEDLIVDVAAIAETVGLGRWHNPTLWNMAKLPFDNVFLPLYADHVCRVIGAMRGKSRRCLVLDLDNTVWNGVIGDDGLEGIVIGQGNATGEAHLALQQTALNLRERGIVLSVSSKNNDDTARLPFQKHPEMLLREEHIAVFQANWSDKATNIKSIAEELSLGLESFVFIDDNPAERGIVRKILPEVAVPELPDDPALYARTLLASGYFEAISFSDEDRKRAGFYNDNARRIALQKGSAGDVDAYLRSLQMVMTIQPFDEVGRSRISQLINKSNQFNLTTRRYTEAQVKEIEADSSYFHLQVRLADTFGDNGMISVIICHKQDDIWEIDTWLMSCRVLGRKVENAVLQELKRAAIKNNIKYIHGVYIPTERNKMVEDHYPKLGFTEIKQSEDGSKVFKIAIDEIKEMDLPILINSL
ncbi:HAD-IIIC family phosphatase [Dickeya oryzae]|uniref:HAD-IIIC family phosphatase n=1 Tax=Dickeya oryzae TaxID=1240404 RepID=UPI00039B4B86|nr:HAD-IIIC family phosphatase [Dickeya oryzae]